MSDAVAGIRVVRVSPAAADGLAGVCVAYSTCRAAMHDSRRSVVSGSPGAGCIVAGVRVTDGPSAGAIRGPCGRVITGPPSASAVVTSVGIVVGASCANTGGAGYRIVVTAPRSCTNIAGVGVRPCGPSSGVRRVAPTSVDVSCGGATITTPAPSWRRCSPPPTADRSPPGAAGAAGCHPETKPETPPGRRAPTESSPDSVRVRRRNPRGSSDIGRVRPARTIHHDVIRRDHRAIVARSVARIDCRRRGAVHAHIGDIVKRTTGRNRVDRRRYICGYRPRSRSIWRCKPDGVLDCVVSIAWRINHRRGRVDGVLQISAVDGLEIRDPIIRHIEPGGAAGDRRRLWNLVCDQGFLRLRCTRDGNEHAGFGTIGRNLREVGWQSGKRHIRPRATLQRTCLEPAPGHERVKHLVGVVHEDIVAGVLDIE